MKRVVIDVDSVINYYTRGWVSGIGRTTIELVKALSQQTDLPVELMLYSQNMKGIGAKNMNIPLLYRHLWWPYRDRWNRVLSHTPIRQWLTHYDLYHIPHNFDHVHHPERTIVTIHDALFFAYPDDSPLHQFARRYYPELARRCRAIITCSESSKRDIVHYMDVPADKIFVTPWGLNRNMFYPNPQPPTGNPFFLMVSCGSKRKNARTLIKAYEQFVIHHPRHELVMVWPNVPDDVVNYCSKEPLRSHVYFEDAVDDERLSRLYNEATATFFPSHYEGFGLPVLESMACGTPVVTCNNSSLPEVGGTAAFYVDADDIDAMAQYMERFENGDFNMVSLRQRCIEQASQFSWQRCAHQTLQAYLATIG